MHICNNTKPDTLYFINNCCKWTRLRIGNHHLSRWSQARLYLEKKNYGRTEKFFTGIRPPINGGIVIFHANWILKLFFFFFWLPNNIGTKSSSHYIEFKWLYHHTIKNCYNIIDFWLVLVCLSLWYIVSICFSVYDSTRISPIDLCWR